MNRSLSSKIFALAMAFIMLIPALTGCVTIGERKPIATITFSNGVEIRARLYPDKAPNTVANFISLANSGFYDGSPVHRIVEYSIVQMGRSADGENDAGYYIKGEFPDNGFSKNDMLHEKGVLSMARTVGAEGNEKEYYNTASSQFFICVDVETTLDGAYAPFGKVISGYDDFEEISRLDVDENYAPRDELYIKSVTVDTYGKDYGEPKKIDKE